MGNTVGTGGVDSGGGGEGDMFGVHDGKGGSGYQSEKIPDMKDSEDTIFVWVKKDVDGQTFIDYAKKAGKIKTDRETGRRMAEMRNTDTGEGTKEGIVTYEQKHEVEKALTMMKELKSERKVIKFSSAEDYLEKKDISDCTKKAGENTAWCFWRLPTVKHQPRGGKGGKGGSSTFGCSRGQDGESGGCGPGGEGGRGGKGGGKL